MGTAVQGVTLFLEPHLSWLGIASHPCVVGVAANAEALA